MGNNVAGGEQVGDFIEIRRVVADMHHQRQAAVFLLDLFGHLQRTDAVLPHHAAADARFDAENKTGQAL